MNELDSLKAVQSKQEKDENTMKMEIRLIPALTYKFPYF